MLYTSLALTALSTFLYLISFSTSEWIVVDADFAADPLCQLENMGLWNFCFKNFRYPNAYYDRVYNKCYWIFSPELWDLTDYLIPSWFQAVQFMMTISFLLMVISTLAIAFKVMMRTSGRTSLAVTGTLNILVTFMTFMSVMVFGHYGHSLENWMPHPSHNGLGYSFGLAVVAGFCALFGGVLALLYRCSKQFVADFDDHIQDILKAPPDEMASDLHSDFQFSTGTGLRTHSRIEQFYGMEAHCDRSTRGDADSQFSDNGPNGSYM